MTEEDVVDHIVELLAEDAGCDPGLLRVELLELGADMPIDSLLAVDILVRLQRATGVTLPATEETAAAMRSVRSFAHAVISQQQPQRSEAS
ncbi:MULTISPECIES: acyl carrier protein [Nocardia]|uniref:acyl carrier protein n=1 Tax=Nocardia abscessus TaxID=120957 RepID=UPI0018949838|nr:acyl carrier protein [Nocardia abscessus]MBF6475271.1 acyl carrier protein [Nocardia abscessus]